MARLSGWRPMSEADLTAVVAVADSVHSGLKERLEVFAERLALYPAGCLVLSRHGEIAGYAISHPIRRFDPPSLDQVIGALAPDADEYFLHDVALAPAMRGSGEGAAGVRRLLRIGQAFATTALISVYGTRGFWARFGFAPSGRDMSAKLRPYGPGAVYMVRDNVAHPVPSDGRD